MKILTVLMKYDYGIKERGGSFEYNNVHLPLVDVFGENSVHLFDFMENKNLLGIEKMNIMLVEKVFSEKYDVVLFCLFENEIFEESVIKINKTSVTIGYFFDDPWRISFTEKWRKIFRFFTTSDFFKYKEYKLAGIKNSIYSPFGFNKNIYKKKNTEIIYEVSFVGGFDYYRKWLVDMLKSKGIEVNVFGRGWGSNSKWLSLEDMVDVFNMSAVNLNLSNSVNYDFNLVLKTMFSLKSLKRLILNKKIREQVKGRHFEINGSGGFQLSYFVPGLNMIYEIEKEIAVFENERTLPDFIKLLLKDSKFREQIAESGYKKSIEMHTAQNYMRGLIEKVV